MAAALPVPPITSRQEKAPPSKSCVILTLYSSISHSSNMYRLYLYTDNIYHIYVFIYIHTPAHTLSSRRGAWLPLSPAGKRRGACQAVVRFCVLFFKRPFPPEESFLSTNLDPFPKHSNFFFFPKKEEVFLCSAKIATRDLDRSVWGSY